tara:strand:- start:229 stop:1125 length:897 start_codon:yes stop_codon:yes gene_type:complete
MSASQTNFAGFITNQAVPGTTLRQLLEEFNLIIGKNPGASSKDSLQPLKKALKDSFGSFLDEKMSLDSLPAHIPEWFRQEGGISRSADPRLAAAMCAAAQEIVGHMIAFAQSEDKSQWSSEYTFTETEKAIKVSITLTNPLSGVSEMIVTVVLHKQLAKWMKGPVQIFCDAVFDAQFHKLHSELVVMEAHQLADCYLAVSAHGLPKYLVPSHKAVPDMAYGLRVTFWHKSTKEAIEGTGEMLGTIHTTRQTNGFGVQAKPDVLARLSKTDIPNITEEDSETLLTEILNFSKLVLGDKS